MFEQSFVGAHTRPVQPPLTCFAGHLRGKFLEIIDARKVSLLACGKGDLRGGVRQKIHKWHHIISLCLILFATHVIQAQEPIRELSGHTEPVTGLVFNAAGTMLASSGDDTSVRFWDVETGEQTAELYSHATFVKGIAAGGESLFASASWDRTVVLYEDEAISETFTGYNAVIEAIAFSPDGEWLAFGVGDGSIQLVQNFEQFEQLPVEALEITALVFSPDSQFLVAAVGFPDDRLYLWRVSDGELLTTMQGHDGAVTGLAFGTYLLSIGNDGRLAFWDVMDNGEAMQVAGSNVTDERLTAIAYHDNQVALGTLSGKILILDISNPETPQTLHEVSAHSGTVNALAYNQEGLLASGGDDGLIRLWQFE